MIGKITKGSGFKGCVSYVLGKDQAKLLDCSGVLTESQQTIINSFCMQSLLNPDIKKPVGHISLSYSANGASMLTDEKMVELAREYMREMKITDTNTSLPVTMAGNTHIFISSLTGSTTMEKPYPTKTTDTGTNRFASN